MIRKGIIVTRDGHRLLGGPGSGNFGHAGTPGQRGGSAPGGGSWGSGKLTQSQQNAIKDYSGDQFQDINQRLRSGSPLTPAQEKLVKDLDAAIDKAPKKDGIVYRTVTFDTPEEAERYANGMIDNQDDIISSPAFVSSTENKAVWGYDLAEYDKKSVRITIVSKTGAKVSEFSDNPREKEVLFKRNTRFKFGGSIANDKGGQPELLWREE